jgi:HD-GYP domain-containing protein (c-di-GMP phosphodiesterase class II)
MRNRSVQSSPESLLEPDEAVTLITASRRCQVATKDLRLGMFVAELDRPWLDTPFLLQGFLADSQVELDTLRKHCTYVYVDLELSNPEVADAIRRSEVRDAPGARDGADGSDADGDAATRPVAAAASHPTAVRRAPSPGRVYRTRSDVRISSDTRQRFRQLVRQTASGSPARDDDGLLGRALGWLRGRVGPAGAGQRAASGDRPQAARDAVRAWLPAGTELVDYEDRHPIEAELPRARAACARCEQALRAVAADVKAGRPPRIAEVAAAAADLAAGMVDNPDALLWVGRLREDDFDAAGHGIRVALFLVALGRQLGLPRDALANLGLVGLLADVGKTRLPRALLDKPGMLAPAEFGLVKEHVRLGLEALRAAGGLPPEVELGIAQHHERLDGTGYPRGLKGADISLHGRMAGIADSFAALIAPRAYANALAPQDALMSLYEWAGTSFHEPLIELFVPAVGVFPVGTLVELSTGEVAVVVARNRARQLEPRVMVLTWPDKSPLSPPQSRDLGNQPRNVPGRVRIVRGLPVGAYGLKLRDDLVGGAVPAADADPR